MSTEPRRIKKLVRNPDWTPADRPLPEDRESRKAPKKALAFALQKVRVIEGCVTLPQLAAERGIQAQLARLWVKAAGVKKPGQRWVWKEGSNALARARKALGLKP